MLTFQTNVLIPIGGMQKRAFVVVQAWDCRPSPVIQDAARIDQDVARIMNLITSR